VALIIGNDAYAISPLKNAVNDARAMDAALRASNFRTILVENAKKADMESKIGEFLDMLGPDDTALFFYAGHGVQIANENFLVPVDFVPGNSTISSAKFSCMSVAQILRRTEPQARQEEHRHSGRLPEQSGGGEILPGSGPRAAAESGQGNLYRLLHRPGQVAADNPDGHNSWFTEALSEYVGQPALTIEINEVFNRVKKRVSDATDGRQTPWTTSSLTAASISIYRSTRTPRSDPTVAEKWFDDAKRREQREDWAEAIDLVNQILKKKPGGTLEEAAKNKLPYLTARKDAQERFEAGDYAAAAQQYEEALKLDPFAIDAAFQGDEQLPPHRPPA
jgi:tetratricopeptide (TPR) repeat protein